MTNYNFNGKTYLITGASSGIGQTTCELIDQLGGNIVLVGRDQEALLNTQSTLKNKNYIKPFDFLNVENIEPWFDEVCNETGPLSGVVHCAGIQLLEPIKLLNFTTIDTFMKVNVNSGLILAKCFRKKKCHTEYSSSLVYLSSVVGCVGADFRSVYSATKGAIIAMTRSLSIELIRDKIRVNCISPGFVKTPMLLSTKKFIGEEAMKEIEKLHPMGFGEPEDITNSIIFLLSPMSKWITGTNLIVDGGYTAQ